jgi:hypothetical protein
MAVTHSFGDATADRVAYRRVAARAAKAAVYGDIHPGVYKIFVGCWAALIAVFLATFAESPFTLFMLAVVIGYSLMFFGVPYVMSRVAPPETEMGKVAFLDFLRGRVQTLTGPVSGSEALMQVLMVPVALTLGSIAIGFIVHLEADHIHTLYVAQSGAFPHYVGQ